MSKLKRFSVSIKKDYFKDDYHMVYITGMIHGLSHGICAIPCGTTPWDIDNFNKFISLPVDCTEESFGKFKEYVDRLWPGLCTFDEIKEL